MKILYFSSVSFGWLKQRPQFVAEHLNKKHSVLYLFVYPIGKGLVKGNSEEIKAKNLTVLPFALKCKCARFINKILVNLKIKFKSFDRIILTHPIQYFYLPKNAEFIYECMDNMSEFYRDRNKENIILAERLVCKKAKKIIASSESLADKLSRIYNIEKDKITVINNALDKAWVNSKSKEVKLNKPNLVYLGTISNWFDFETVKYYSEKNKNSYIYLVGSVEKDIDISSLPENIVFVGSVPHNEVLSYIKSADILLMPFKVNELTKCVDPVKMYEYLAFNKTVICSYWNELDKFKRENVFFYKTKEEFLELIKTVKASETKISQQFVEENCWEKRMLDYETALND